MTDVVASYEDLIKETFISPIRSVTVIDDEYPTFSSLLEGNTNLSDKRPNTSLDDSNVDRLRKIIQMCHAKYCWSIDIFDGKTPALGSNEKNPYLKDENSIPAHIHHSDLIILDYHLDGDSNIDDGSRARKIIKSLDSNNHYNLALIHTKGNDGDIKKVFTDILLEFFTLAPSHFLNTDESISEKMDDWLDENNEGRGHLWITDNIPLLNILEVCKQFSSEKDLNPLNPACPLHAFSSEIDSLAKEIGLDKTDLVRWRLTKQLKDYHIRQDNSSRTDLQWNWDESTNFISTSKIFISVVRKSTNNPEDELIGSLSKALCHHNASPMQLLMARMRYELDERGIGQATEIMNNRYAQAGWLFDLLKNGESDYAHEKAINLHWEQLANASRGELRQFSKRILAAVKNKHNSDEKTIVKSFFKECISKRDLTLGHLNAYSCSMPVRNTHLVTGTVLNIDNEIWICLSPACDLVPEQRTNTWKHRIGDNHLVFRAVKFEKIDLCTANNRANKNNYIYININNSPEAYSIGDSNPHWDIFYAADQGRFIEDTSLSLLSPRMIDQDETPELVMKPLKATAISELRYEYALNLLHKFGVSQTRVGLDFRDQNSLWN
ncbi:response regulator receiver domain [Tatumella sp. JGM118]|uniref:response regulator receiver domain n=1 Tax=Tatumella sp. JGM118 TaxID=2799796 RepID=UPI001BAF9BF7|nr:response regulator receiver domain [Tatumella sp. JGM118]MBS0908062.1 hypothetical protein [Tatumella sp. JGM118]